MLGPDFSKAVAAIDGLVGVGLEGNFGGFSAIRARSREHLAGGIAISGVSAVTAGLLRLPGLPARRAALGLVGEALGLEKFLVFDAERKRYAAIGTHDGFIFETHMGDLLSFETLVGVRVTRY
jgi:hypothetical protein